MNTSIEHMVTELASKYLDAMTDEEIVAECPMDYGQLVTPVHQLYVFNMLCEELSQRDAIELYHNYQYYVVRNHPVPKHAKDNMSGFDEYIRGLDRTLHVAIAAKKKLDY